MKAAIYCRLSEEDRNKQNQNDDSESIQNQKSMLIQYAMDHNWDMFGIYSDDDYTGSDRSRPDFNRLLNDAEAKQFDVILCKTQSRFTRELELVEKYIHGLFPKWGIRFVSIVDNADTEVKGNKKARQINGLINEWYLEDMSENIKSVLTNRRKNGFHIGAFALYGYKKDTDKKGHLIIDEEAAEIVREVFRLFSQGYGKTAIARILNDRGIPNPTEYKRLHGLRYKQPDKKNSTLWKYFAISDMLINEIYIGNMVQGKYGSISYKTKENKPLPKDEWIRVKGTHEPIIDMVLWNRVQDMVRQRAKPFITGNIGLFAKKVRCMECGYVMRSSKNRGKHYLQCSTKFTAKGACNGSFVAVNTLEKTVLNELRDMIDEYLDKDEIEHQVQWNSNLDDKIAKLRDEIDSYEKKTSTFAKSIKDLYIDKTEGIITETEFVEFSREFSKDKERLEKLKAESNDKLQSLLRKSQSAFDKRQRIEEYTNLERLTREHVEVLVDHIEIGKRDPETKELPVDIHWNF